MESYKVLEETMYDVEVEGVSMFSGDLVKVIGECTIELEDGKVLEQYLYNIVGYTAKNGKPFMGLKNNISILGGK